MMLEFISNLFCGGHEYEKVNQFSTKSEMDIRKINNAYTYSNTKTLRYVITDYSCIKCGRIKRFKEKEG